MAGAAVLPRPAISPYPLASEPEGLSCRITESGSDNQEFPALSGTGIRRFHAENRGERSGIGPASLKTPRLLLPEPIEAWIGVFSMGNLGQFSVSSLGSDPVPAFSSLFQHAGALPEPEGLTRRMAAVGVPEPVSGPTNGNDDCGTGFGTGDCAQASQGRSGQLGIRNTIVFGTKVVLSILPFRSTIE